MSGDAGYGGVTPFIFLGLLLPMGKLKMVEAKTKSNAEAKPKALFLTLPLNL